MMLNFLLMLFFLASASFDKSVKIWNGNTGLFLFNLRGHVGNVYQISWSILRTRRMAK